MNKPESQEKSIDIDTIVNDIVTHFKSEFPSSTITNGGTDSLDRKTIAVESNGISKEEHSIVYKKVFKYLEKEGITVEKGFDSKDKPNFKNDKHLNMIAIIS